MSSSAEKKVTYFSERTIILIIVLFASAVWAFVYILPLFDEDKLYNDKLHNDLKLISDGKASAAFISSYDLICFTLANTGAKRELLAEKKRLGANFALSPDSCGLDRSCCNLMSDAIYIGLVKNEQVRCLRAENFSYWIEGNVARCIAPRNLQVREQTTAPSAIEQAGRAKFDARGSNFRIMEMQ